ncbi:hypothetical protein HX866_12695 [Pseudomonas gingeri]|uniref:hypothetical protein n=1 Tax=Pseudomonas gingeri TaxID=117681 RepID=UPI0015A0DF20|nr:hypothetical protein [Pseudomonas gingeri]NWA25749.1 hypothetical protein [Pseudomonas gingeri]
MASRKLIIDTNLFLLLVIGSIEERRHIKNSNRLNSYTSDDFDVLLEVMKAHSEICLTPYIAAEVSNLIDLNGDAKHKAFDFAKYYFSTFTQIKTNLRVDTGLNDFLLYGLTDCSLASLCSEYNIVTNDNKLLPALFAVSHDNVIPFEAARAAYGK